MPSRFPFDKLENVILTPHSSAWTDRVVALRVRDIAANIDRLAPANRYATWLSMDEWEIIAERKIREAMTEAPSTT